MDASNFVVLCPHCEEPVLIEATNCCIFRHGVLKESGIQINPHSSIELCTYYVNNNKIHGCGKPFKLVLNEKQEIVAVVCDYI
jgi:hypothetical protein